MAQAARRHRVRLHMLTALRSPQTSPRGHARCSGAANPRTSVCRHGTGWLSTANPGTAMHQQHCRLLPCHPAAANLHLVLQTLAQPHARPANPHTLMRQHCKPWHNHAAALQTLAPCCPDTANPLSAHPTAPIPLTATCRHRKPSSPRLGTPHSFAHPCRGGCAPVRTRAGCCRPGEPAPRYRWPSRACLSASEGCSLRRAR